MECVFFRTLMTKLVILLVLNTVDYLHFNSVRMSFMIQSNFLRIINKKNNIFFIKINRKKSMIYFINVLYKQNLQISNNKKCSSLNSRKYKQFKIWVYENHKYIKKTFKNVNSNIKFVAPVNYSLLPIGTTHQVVLLQQVRKYCV